MYLIDEFFMFILKQTFDSRSVIRNLPHKVSLRKSNENV